MPLVIALLALAYAFSGWLSVMLAVPPGYAAPVFPPAGLALAALLIFGQRAWPGVLIGSLVVQVIAGINTDLRGWVWLGSAIVPIGATLQALAGVWLTRRLIGYPTALDTQQSILRFLCVVAPVACLISPCIAIPSLIMSGALSPDDAAFNWLNWWLGDTLGVAVVTPLVMVFLAEPRQDWRPRSKTVALPLLVALAALGFAYLQVSNWEEQRLQAQFRRDVDRQSDLIRKRLDVQLDMMLSMERLMAVSTHTSREEWRDFVTPWLERYPGAQNFSWNPYVTGAERGDFEAGVSAYDQPGYRILDRDLAGNTIVARTADEYLPILYVEPIASNRSVLGLNPLALPSLTAAIRRSRDSGKPMASQPLRLVQEDQSQRAVVVYQAVFGRKADGTRDPAHLTGIITGAMRMDNILRASLSGSVRDGIEVCLVDQDSEPGNRRLSGPSDCDLPLWQRLRMSVDTPIDFAGRRWSLVLRASDAYLAANRSWSVWTTLAAGLGMVSVLGAFLLLTSGYTRRVEAQVEERTGELEGLSQRLQAQQDQLAEAQRIAHLGSWELDHELQTLSCSDELRRMLDLPLTLEISVDQLLEQVDPSCRDRLQMMMMEARHAPLSAQLDCSQPGDALGKRTLHWQIESDWEGDSLRRLRGTVQDVTSVRQAEAHIQYLARYDALTGLPNRSQWLERARVVLPAAQRHGDMCAVLFLDLDNFKTINDSLGHPVGDRVLSAVAGRLAQCLREEDCLARLGGDEFVVLLPRLNRVDDAAIVATKLLDSLAHAIAVDQNELRSGASIGIAIFPADGEDIDTLLKHADVAMYGAKHAGRNNYQYFVPEMNVRALQRLQMEGALRRALDLGEFVLHYQPQLDLARGAVDGCEALVRWLHPERGLIPPMEFIPVAEDTGMILPMGDWILRSACRQQAAWAAEGHDLTMAINISALQFEQSTFADKVATILRETGAQPHRIELEITESALMRPSDELMARLEKIRALGVTLALDDFGTGYSSLAYLKRFPIQRLKLDRSFVKDLPGDAEDGAIATATLSLARDLGMDVVAEGVETQAQRDYLSERGCKSIQGYLIGRPMPAAAFMDWMDASPAATSHN